jgi:hypothetical protein
MKMKLLKLFVLFFSMNALASGGDIGGGGTLPQAFQLTPQERAQLSLHRDPNLAYEAWLNTLNERKQEQLLQNVFENLILPQIRIPR